MAVDDMNHTVQYMGLERRPVRNHYGLDVDETHGGY